MLDPKIIVLNFKLNDDTSNTTVKGFTQNSVTNHKIKFDSIKYIVYEEQDKKNRCSITKVY